MRDEELESLVGLLGRAESRVLSRGPRAGPVAFRVNAPRERVLAGIGEVLLVVEANGFQIFGTVTRF